MPNCRDCQAPIIWASRDKGHKMPFDERPVVGPEGHRLYKIFQFNGEQIAEVADPRYSFGARYTSHFDTCPNRKDYQ